MHRLGYLATICLTGLALSAPVAQSAPPVQTTVPASAKTIKGLPHAQPVRISRLDARGASHAIFDNLAGALDQKLVISPCVPKGRLSRVCVIRINMMRFRLVASPIGTENMRVSVTQLSGR